jgi:dihydrofolate synthase/folylpolyglutamate synthase
VTYADAIKYLYDLQLFGTKLGLENTYKLAAVAGNPQDRLRFIHVAGTNGKGSTCAMLESIYRAAGLKVGLFTSPHLVRFGERIQINRELISEAEVVKQVEGTQKLMKDFPANEHPTFFEVVVIMALRYFAEQQCDLVIWETGLGGRFDATNIVIPLASVITNIQFDHQKWLGDTLEKIAFEKAGIIKPGVPVLTAVDDPEAFRILFETAKQNGSGFSLITWTQTEYHPLKGMSLPLLGEHQRLNAALAAHTVMALRPQIPVTDENIREGLSNVKWQGRLQIIEGHKGQKLLLDGAHNVGGAQTLKRALQTYFAAKKPTFIIGILRDKDAQSICEILAPLAERILLVPVSNQRTAQPEETAPICRKANPTVEIRECVSLAEAFSIGKADSFLVVTGSLYLIGEALELLESLPSKNERGLNEWGAGGLVQKSIS